MRDRPVELCELERLPEKERATAGKVGRSLDALREIEHRHVETELDQALDELTASASRQNEVGDEKIDRPREHRDERNRLARLRGADDGMPTPLERCANEIAQGGVVLDDEDRLLL